MSWASLLSIRKCGWAQPCLQIAKAPVDSWVQCRLISRRQHFTTLLPDFWLCLYSFHPLLHLVPWMFKEIGTFHLGIGTQQSLILSTLISCESLCCQHLLQTGSSPTKVNTLAIWEYKCKCLEGSFTSCLFSKTTGIGSSLGLMLSQPWGLPCQTWLSSCRGSLQSN